jgi:hypothetical protein
MGHCHAGRERPQTKGCEKVKMGEKEGRLVPPAGLEPATNCLEGSRSVRLSYGGTGLLLGKSPQCSNRLLSSSTWTTLTRPAP